MDIVEEFEKFLKDSQDLDLDQDPSSLLQGKAEAKVLVFITLLPFMERPEFRRAWDSLSPAKQELLLSGRIEEIESWI